MPPIARWPRWTMILPHPEYDAAHLQDLFTRGRNVFLDGATADKAAAEIKAADVPRDLDAMATAAFFRQALAAKT